MSHSDPMFDPDNSYEDDMNYDDYNDFYGEVDADDLENGWDDDENSGEVDWYDDVDDSMDGDHDSAMESCGWGTDEDYGYYGDDTPMYEDYYGGE